MQFIRKHYIAMDKFLKIQSYKEETSKQKKSIFLFLQNLNLVNNIFIVLLFFFFKNKNKILKKRQQYVYK